MTPPTQLDVAKGTVPFETLGSGVMFDRIARRYDLVNRVISLGLDQRWRRAAVRAMALGPGGRSLDVATGTGDLAMRMAKSAEGVTVRAVDPSSGMLAIGRDKIRRAGLEDRVVLEVGDAQALDFDDDSFDASAIAFGIRNVPDRARGLAEMARVTRPGGRVVVLELSEPPPGILGALARFHVHWLVPRIGALLSGAREYRYLHESIAAFPRPDAFAALMESAGMRVVAVRPMTLGACCLFVGEPR